MTDEIKCPHVWFPQNRVRQKQMERIYLAALKFQREFSVDKLAPALTDFYTCVLSVNQMGELLPAFAAQLAFEAAMADA